MKKKEIGSEYEAILVQEEKKLDNIFFYLKDYNSIYYDSGRSSLIEIIGYLQPKKVLLPSYICESVLDCFKKYNCEVEYYFYKNNLNIDWDDLFGKITKSIDLVFIYFFNGFIDCDFNLKKLKKLQEKIQFKILEDTTHSIFTNKNIIGDYCICSLRKWFPIPDGGVLYFKEPNKNLKINKKENKWYKKKYEAMKEKSLYLKGEIKTKEKFLKTFYDSEEELDSQQSIFGISKLSYSILLNCDINKIKNKRKLNANYLYNKLKNLNLNIVSYNDLENDIIPMFFTILIKNRDNLRKFLINSNIYCPVHWPMVSDLEFRKNVEIYSSKELSIPIDQRYDLNDMQYIIEKIYKFLEL